jgi:DNA-binding GntR family transcriptional regulator
VYDGILLMMSHPAPPAVPGAQMPQRTTMQHLAAPLRQQVVQLLRQDILDATLTPGERLRESDLCERYGVSRTVVREALRQLESESLITMLPNRGPIVTILRVKDIESLYEVRARLEGLAGEMFAKRASAADAAALLTHLHVMEIRYLHGSVDERAASKDEFYNLLLRGADNEVLTSTLRGVHTRIGILRHYAYVDQQRVNISMEEVRRIVDATAVRRDPELARTTCEDHIRRAGELAVIEYQRHNRSAMVS